MQVAYRYGTSDSPLKRAPQWAPTQKQEGSGDFGLGSGTAALGGGG